MDIFHLLKAVYFISLNFFNFHNFLYTLRLNVLYFFWI